MIEIELGETYYRMVKREVIGRAPNHIKPVIKLLLRNLKKLKPEHVGHGSIIKVLKENKRYLAIISLSKTMMMRDRQFAEALDMILRPKLIATILKFENPEFYQAITSSKENRKWFAKQIKALRRILLPTEKAY